MRDGCDTEKGQIYHILLSILLLSYCYYYSNGSRVTFESHLLSIFVYSTLRVLSIEFRHCILSNCIQL